MPARHVSRRVQAFPSSQRLPSGFSELEHTPVAGSHTPASWHWSAALQTTAAPPMQVPAWHVSFRVHAFPSSQVLPSDFVGLEQTPVAGLQTPASWQWSAALQTTGSRPVQVPAWHVSFRVHAFPSSHVVPSDFVGLEQTPVAGLQTPASWHWSAALQATGARAVPVPSWHVSARVHALPSS